MQRSKEKLKQHKQLYGLISRIKEFYNCNILVRREEEHKCYRGSKDLKFFVLRRSRAENGIASNIIVFMSQMKYMEQHHKGYQPIIDMQNYPQSISETTGEAGNAWEDFFLQPNGSRYGMADQDKASKVILACARDNCYKYPKQSTYDDLVKDGWDRCFERYIVLKPELIEQFSDDWDKLTSDNGKIVGVKVRGTDYVSLKPAGHRIQPTAKQVIKKVKEFLAERPEYQYIFLSTEDRKIYDEIVEIFQSKVISVDNSRIEYSGGMILDAKNTGELSKRMITEQYLEDMYFLSKCDSLICGNTSSLVPTLLWNAGKYEDVYVFDLGFYT